MTQPFLKSRQPWLKLMLLMLIWPLSIGVTCQRVVPGQFQLAERPEFLPVLIIKYQSKILTKPDFNTLTYDDLIDWLQYTLDLEGNPSWIQPKKDPK